MMNEMQEDLRANMQEDLRKHAKALVSNQSMHREKNDRQRQRQLRGVQTRSNEINSPYTSVAAEVCRSLFVDGL